MTTDTERRLRAALEASAELITDSQQSINYQPPTDQLDYSAQRNARSRRLGGRWAGPLLAAAAVVVVTAGATGIARTVSTHQARPATHRSSPPVTSPSPSPSASPSTTAAGQPPLSGPQVSDAELFAGGHGYVHTQHSLLWTDDLGASWRNITPPGLTAAQLQSATIAVLPDGHQWLALTPASGSKSVTLLRRSSNAQPWTRSSIPIGTLTTLPNPSTATSLSFIDPDNGWLMIEESITHETLGQLLYTTDGGATWTLQADQRALPAVGTIHFLTPTIGYLDANSATGSRGWWSTSSGGQSWTQLQLPTPAANKSDSINILSAPTLAGDAIVLAASFTTPVEGTNKGIGIYRSTDGGASWTVHIPPIQAATDQYHFAATADGSAYLLLGTQPTQDLQTLTWVTTHTNKEDQSFTDTSGGHNYYPGPLTLADPDHLWTVAGANGCTNSKTDCQTTAALIASTDGGLTWHQVRLPS